MINKLNEKDVFIDEINISDETFYGYGEMIR